MQIIFTMGGTVGAWVVVLGTLFLTRNLPYEVFVIAHYMITIAVFGVLVVALRNADVRCSAGMLTCIIVGTLLSLELFYWVFVNPAAAGRYLTMADWVIPAILVTSTVYVVAKLVRQFE